MVSSLATAVAYREGMGSGGFAIAVVLAVIVGTVGLIGLGNQVNNNMGTADAAMQPTNANGTWAAPNATFTN